MDMVDHLILTGRANEELISLWTTDAYRPRIQKASKLNSFYAIYIRHCVRE
ncbi:Hypothetical Protein XCAW_02584 [Xanthomonas citri subsp. citri Aw12879]|uniref:Uncharacterized protein n=1 Tax=Xanthomonas citri pv. citri TaxID=611301 RepID=A0A0U5FEI6_XANCI|nr:Hypothetical Protein XCAW_02584 [Xanthomonas citri subsp. citri Aw12879]CEE23817.1 hypothetical protein XAC9322_320004 [Xanthomonas citri pv. citri]CEE79522.1 hypothetical protein XACLE20_1870004 [Xanthomonas citri pv. citri]CEG16116.1 hypothetical protein XAC3562_300004 [Xanthomonas citri pv. citri]CEH47605.1 hypothetical protein XACLG97_4180004 [Xanthomonas citri pv. citri]